MFLFQFQSNDIIVSNDCCKVKFLLLFLYKDLYWQGSPLNVLQHLTGLGWVFFCQSSYWMYSYQVSWYHNSFHIHHFSVCRMEENCHPKKLLLETVNWKCPGNAPKKHWGTRLWHTWSLSISFPSLELLRLCKTENSDTHDIYWAATSGSRSLPFADNGSHKIQIILMYVK